MTNSLSEQVAELEAERDRLKADAMSDLTQRHWLETQVRNREAERDDLQRQVQEARFSHKGAAGIAKYFRGKLEAEMAENDALRAGQGRWPGETIASEDVPFKGMSDLRYKETALPRVITADELREGQVIAYTSAGRWVAEPYEPHVAGFGVNYAGTIVLLKDAPQPEPEPVTAETIRASEPGSTWEDKHGAAWEWTGGGMAYHSQFGDLGEESLTEYVVQQSGPFTRSSAAPRGDYGPRKLTVQGLEVAPVGSTVQRGRNRLAKIGSSTWIGFNGLVFTSKEVIDHGWSDATLTTPEQA